MNLEELQDWPTVPDCDSCDGADCTKPTKLFDHSYPTCPFFERRQPRWQAVIDIYNAISVQPVEGWPRRWAPWVVRGVTALTNAAREREIAKIKES